MKSYLKCSKVSAFKSYLGLCSKGLENWKNYIHINGVIVLKFYMEPGQLGFLICLCYNLQHEVQRNIHRDI